VHIVAHRGYSGKYPELSPLAFEKAMELPIHGVECDVRLSRDGRGVVQHDPTLERTTGRAGRGGAPPLPIPQLTAPLPNEPQLHAVGKKMPSTPKWKRRLPRQNPPQ